jgi:hypothetical protein
VFPRAGVIGLLLAAALVGAFAGLLWGATERMVEQRQRLPETEVTTPAPAQTVAR